MKSLRPLTAAALFLAACGPGVDPAPAPKASLGQRQPRVLATFEGDFDSATGAIRFRGPSGDLDPASVLPTGEGASAVTLATTNLTTVGTACGGTSFEGDVTLTNHGAAAIDNAYVEIQSFSTTGRESCNSTVVPRPGGSSTVSAANGLWAYGSIAGGGGTSMVRWRFPNPSSAHYTFKGRVIGAGALAAHGGGNGWGAAIDDVVVDSDGAALYVSVKFNTPPAADNLYLLVDDTFRTSGMGGADALAYDPTGAWGALSANGTWTLANDVGADFDYFQAGFFSSGGTLTQVFHKTITGAASSVDAAGAALTQDAAAGRYNFRIPYAAIGSGASAGDEVRVYVLYGLGNAHGGDLGIHSAAPKPSQAQVDLMNAAASHGLASLDRGASGHVLAAACDPPLVISAVYGGSTASSATFNQDFVELHNRSSQPFTIPAGWTLQYGSATGVFGGSTGTNFHALPTVTVPAGGYLLIKEATGSGTSSLPAGDASGTLNFSATSGKLMIWNGATAAGTTCPVARGQVIDMVGWGSSDVASCQGVSMSGHGTTTMAVRNGGGCDDTDSSSADFSASAAAAPHNSSSAPSFCPAVCD